jgi:hypothetical protein
MAVSFYWINGDDARKVNPVMEGYNNMLGL